MPELPEVETTRCGIEPLLTGRQFSKVVIREHRLRWPVPDHLPSLLPGLTLHGIQRRAKYLLFDAGQGWLLGHLGMSGSFRVLTEPQPIRKHDHLDLELDGGAEAGGVTLRYHDPRRFGCLLWIPDNWQQHALIRDLGPEPLSDAFNADYLHHALQKRGSAIKLALMDNHVVVGVGNIYASEALFLAGIHPQAPACQLDKVALLRLVQAVKQVLTAALASGGSTLRDYVNARGDTGYFQLTLNVYDRSGEPCRQCGTPISKILLGQRSSFFCTQCQSMCQTAHNGG